MQTAARTKRPNKTVGRARSRGTWRRDRRPSGSTRLVRSSTAMESIRHRSYTVAVGLLALLASSLPGARCDGGGGLASALDTADRCALTSKDLWPCLRKGLTVALEYPTEIPLIGPYMTAGSVTGRAKKDKGAGVLALGGMMMIATLLSTTFGALAMMTVKGMMTSVLALVLSTMAIAKKSGHGHARTTYEVINSVPSHGFGRAPVGYHQADDVSTAVSEVEINNSQYNAAQTEPVQYGNQQYD